MVRISISEGVRSRLSLALAIITWILNLSGIGLAILGAYIKIQLLEYTNLVEDYDGNTLPIFLVVTGGAMTLVHTAGGLVLLKTSDPSNRKRFGLILLVFVASLAVMTVLILVSAILCYMHVDHLDDSFKAGITGAMQLYRDNSLVKEEIDRLQMDFGCCGNENYNEWHQVEWDNPHSKDSVPFSCCDPKSPRPCIRHLVHDNSEHANYDYKADLTLHHTGCREALIDFYGDTILSVCAMITMVAFAIELIVTIMARYLQTSMATAVDRGDPGCNSPGWLLPFMGPGGIEDEKLPLTVDGITLDVGDVGDGALSVYGSDLLPRHYNTSGANSRASINRTSRQNSRSSFIPPGSYAPSKTGSQHRSLDDRLSVRRGSSGGGSAVGDWNSRMSGGGSRVSVRAGVMGGIPAPPPPPPLPNH